MLTNNLIKHYDYLGHWVYFVVDTVHIADLDGNVIVQWPATETDRLSFIDPKARMNDMQDGMILVHGIVPKVKGEEEPKKKKPIPKSWQLVIDGKHPTRKEIRTNG